MVISIGHRGAPALEPENTLRSYWRAVQCQADYIEVDVRRSRDGELIIMHDPTVDRTTDGTGRVGDLSLAEIKELDLGLGEKVPTIQEVLEFAEDWNIDIIIEVKERGFEPQLIQMIRERGLLPRIMVTSFDHGLIRGIKQLEPHIKTGIITEKRPVDPVEFAREYMADAIFPRIDVTDESLVKDAHQGGVEVYVWTLREEDQMRYALRLGIDGAATDDPCLFDRVRTTIPAVKTKAKA